MRHATRRPVVPAVASLLLTLLLGACSSTPPAGGVQVEDRERRAAAQRQPVNSGQYVVQRGDTLYSIAFRFGWDWKALAARNGIAAPYTIHPGQRIQFASQGATPATRPPVRQPVASVPPATRPVQTPPPVTRNPPPSTRPGTPPVVATRPPQSTPPTAPAQMPSGPVVRSAKGWAWPATGPVISRFSSNGSLNKGIDLAGELGQPVLAASDGTVVYAGSGLRGYGELLIIKHSDTYVSAYGHNRRLLVQEGQQVRVGQRIAEMGSTGTDRVKLHFEIRRQGKPVDPLQYLPAR